MATYAIGDIHGCDTALTTLLSELNPSPDDTFVFLGDYIDRGPGSRQVLDLLMTFAKTHDTLLLKGNHDIMMEQARNQPEILFNWLRFGGLETLKSFDITPAPGWHAQLPKMYWEFIRTMQSYHITDEHIFVHAGLETGISMDMQDEQHLFWNKYNIPDRYDHRQVICGHTARKDGQIANFGHTICIDTFCYGGQWLTALNVTSGKFLQANENGQTRSGLLQNP